MKKDKETSTDHGKNDAECPNTHIKIHFILV